MVLVERGWWSIVSVAAVAGRAKRIPRSCISRSGTGIRHRVRVGLTPIRRRGHERTNERTNEQANERTSEYEHIRRVCPSIHIGPCLSLPLAVWRTSGSRSVQTPHYCEQCTRGINARARSLARSYTCQVARHVRAHCTHDRNTFFPSFFPCGGSKTRRVGPCDKNDLFHPPQKENKKNHGIFRDSARAVSFSCSFRQDFFYDRLQFMLTRFSKIASRTVNFENLWSIRTAINSSS